MRRQFGVRAVAAGLTPRSVAGTPGFLAPEVLERTRGYPVAPDWWSVGVSLYRMLHGRAPHSRSAGQGCAFVLVRDKDPGYTNASNRLKLLAVRDLLLRLLQVDPAQTRVGAGAVDIEAHDFCVAKIGLK